MKRLVSREYGKSGIVIFLSLFFFLVGSKQLVKAQMAPSVSISLDDGLSQSVVKSIVQDKSGFLWFGTEYGLNRYDGRKMVSFYEHEGLPSGDISYLTIDRAGVVWVGTDKGVSVYVNDSFSVFEGTDTLFHSSVNDIQFSKDGSIWIATEGEGVWIYNGLGFDRWGTDNGLPSDSVRSITFDSYDSNSIAFGTKKGVAFFLQAQFYYVFETDGLLDNRIRKIIQKDTNDWWVGTRSGVNHVRFDKKTRTLEKVEAVKGLAAHKITDMITDSQNRVWITTENGVIVWDRGKTEWFNTTNGLEASYFYTLYEDNESNLWLGSLGSGAIQFLGDLFRNLTTDNGLSNPVVSTIYKDEKGQLWVGTFGGGISLFRSTGTQPVYVNEMTGTLPSDKVYHIVPDADSSKIVIATREGIAVYTKELKQVVHPVLKSIPRAKYRFILPERGNRYWLATEDEGVFFVSTGGLNKITVENGLISNSTRVLLRHSSGKLFVGTTGGISIIQGDSIRSLSLQNGLINQVVLDMIETADGSVWFTHYQGITQIKTDGTLFHVPILFHDEPVVAYLIREHNHILWVGTNHGLVHYAYKEKEPRFKFYTSAMGLVNDEHNKGAIFIDHESYFWLGTVNGLSRFKPDYNRRKENNLTIYFDEVYVQGKQVSTRGTIYIPYNDNNFMINYGAISFTDPKTLLYEYRLRGVDPKWIQTHLTNIRYAGLAEGEYEFQVRVIDRDGNRSRPAVQKVTVLPPFWRSPWFLFIVISVVGIVIYLIVTNIRVSRMVETERIRVRIASDLHDDIGASLTEIALQADFIHAITDDEENKQALQELAERSRKIVTTMDDIVWSIDARNDTLGDLTDRIQDYANNVCAQKDIQISYQFNGLDSSYKLHSDTRQHIYLITKEAVNNAVKYAQASQLTIALSKEKNGYQLKISDNGNGIGTNDSTKKTGHGLKNMKERAKKIHGTLTLENSNGFTVTVSGIHL